MEKSEKPLVIPVFIPHSGCPHQCAFCNQSIITRQSAASFSDSLPDQKTIHDNIISYLKYKGNRTRVELAFFGGNFLGLPENRIMEQLEMIQPYIREKQIDSIRCSTRPDTITQDILDQIRPYHMSAIELGIQSMNDHVLKKNQRGHNSEDSIQALALLKKNRFKIGVQVMAGLPGDTPESLLDSTRKLAGLKPDFARIYPLVVIKDSLVEKWYRQEEYIPLSLDEAVCQVKQMHQIFAQANIDVIRMGLQASDFMEDETKVIAGPWHPAFGHLVFSALMYDQVCSQIENHPDIRETGHVIIKVNPRSESRLRGNQNSNIKNLKKKYPHLTFSINPDALMPLNSLSTLAV